MFLETILTDAVHTDDSPRRSASTLAGRWRNRLGSTMEITVDSDHHVHGTFHLNGGGAGPASTFRIVGFAEGDALSFCVDFGNRGSVAAWSGHHLADSDGERLVTLWHLARPVRDPHTEADVWAALLAGGDHFERAD